VISVHSNILMRKHILQLLAFGPIAAAAQTPTVRLMNVPDASSKPEFAMVAAVRQLAGGRLLVNDIQNRQLTILDPGLANAFVLADSTSGQLNSYGTRAGGLIRYVGDSTLFVDPAGLSMFVIDPNGKIARVASVPRSQDAPSLGNNLLGTPGVDAAGRLVYRSGGLRITQQNGGKGGGGGGFMMPDFPDSTAIVRVDLATRKVDTAAYYKIPKTKMNIVQTDKGMSATNEINPMPIVDDWAVLSNGSVAIVRGQDYHVDILKADGTLASAAKVPFDWQRLSDEEKVAVIDSAKAALERARAAGPGDGNAVIAGGARGGGPGAAPGGMVVMSFQTTGPDGGGVGNKIASMGGGMQPSFVSASELPDYRPAFNQGAARADEDGNVWVRTSATRAGAIGGLIYDVINGQGALVDRVQIPAGRTIVGFGKGGVVYMVARDKTGAWIERTHR
jgi:hypothetical protein